MWSYDMHEWISVLYWTLRKKCMCSTDQQSIMFPSRCISVYNVSPHIFRIVYSHFMCYLQSVSLLFVFWGINWLPYSDVIRIQKCIQQRLSKRLYATVCIYVFKHFNKHSSMVLLTSYRILSRSDKKCAPYHQTVYTVCNYDFLR